MGRDRRKRIIENDILKGDVESCLNEAQGFLKTAKWCGKEFIGMPEQMKYVFVVNIAFACELFIKAISLSEYGYFYKGHDLKYQFSTLRQSTQEKIKNSYYEKSELSLHGNNLERFLVSCQNDFEKWRYAFEENGLLTNGSNFLVFAECLQKYACSLGEKNIG